MQRLARLASALAIVLAVAACAGTAAEPTVPASPAVNAARATEILEGAMRGLNEGDYAAWAADWSDTMKAAIREPDFLAFRDQLIATAGRYVSLGTPVLSSTAAGIYRWTFPVTFEKTTSSVYVAFFDGSTKVDGIRFE